MRWVGAGATGLCLTLLAGASLVGPSHAVDVPQKKVFAQIDEVVATTDGSGPPRVWLGVPGLTTGVEAGCAGNGGWLFVTEGGERPWLDAIETLARSAKAARFKILLEYAVGDPVAQPAGTVSTRCRISRLSLGD